MNIKEQGLFVEALTINDKEVHNVDITHISPPTGDNNFWEFLLEDGGVIQASGNITMILAEISKKQATEADRAMLSRLGVGRP